MPYMLGDYLTAFVAYLNKNDDCVDIEKLDLLRQCKPHIPYVDGVMDKMKQFAVFGRLMTFDDVVNTHLRPESLQTGLPMLNDMAAELYRVDFFKRMLVNGFPQ